MPFDGVFNWDSIPVVAKVGADPAVEVAPDGAAYFLTVPASTRWKIATAEMTLVCSADAANRTLAFQITDGTNVVYQSNWGVTITAGQTKVQSWMAGSFITAAGTQYGMHIPDIELMAGWKVGVVSSSFDTVAAGDNASALTIFVKVVPA